MVLRLVREHLLCIQFDEGLFIWKHRAGIRPTEQCVWKQCRLLRVASSIAVANCDWLNNICAACIQDSLDLASMYLHSRPLSDSEDLLPTCYRCGSSNPLVNPQVLSLLTCTLQLLGCFAFGNAIVTHKCLWPIN